MITCKNDRLLELLWFVGYCIEFPTQLAVRIGGGAEWNRRVMYRAIREGYVRLYRKKHKRHVIRSMSLTQKGFEYVAQRDPEALSMIYSRVNSSERVYPGWIDKILRLHAIAIGTVMSNAAGATLLISQKPSLMSPAKRATNAVVPDSNKIYYYAAHELRVAIEEYSPESVSKSSRTIGIIVKGRCCFFLYFTGSTRMYWMKNSEENYAAAVKSLLLARGFGITSIHQIVIGSTMSVAQRLCHGAKPFGNKYFVVSTFFAQCLFLTNNKEGDTLLKLILHDELAMEINHAALSPFYNLDASHGYQLYKLLHDARVRRRKCKNAIAWIDFILEQRPERFVENDPSARIVGTRSRDYAPRALPELFEWENEGQTNISVS